MEQQAVSPTAQQPSAADLQMLQECLQAAAGQQAAGGPSAAGTDNVHKLLVATGHKTAGDVADPGAQVELSLGALAVTSALPLYCCWLAGSLGCWVLMVPSPAGPCMRHLVLQDCCVLFQHAVASFMGCFMGCCCACPGLTKAEHLSAASACAACTQGARKSARDSYSKARQAAAAAGDAAGVMGVLWPWLGLVPGCGRSFALT